MKRAFSPVSRQSRGAFTLIELLTVIAIIGILAAILFPVLGKARDSAKNSQCTSNLRQIGIALFLYAADNHNTLPAASNAAGSSNNWVPAITPYLPLRKAGTGSLSNGVFVCPACDKTYSVTSDNVTYSYTVLGGFMVENPSAGVYDSTTSGRNMSTIASPSRAGWLTDGAQNGTYSGVAYSYISANQVNTQTLSHVDFRHGTNSANMLFADGAVRPCSSADVATIFPDATTWRGLR